MISDLKFALRQLLKSPGFTTVAVLSLALGIGANTAAFSLLNAVLLQRLPVRSPEELVVFNWLAEPNVGPSSSSGFRQRDAATGKSTSTSFSFPTFEQFRANASALSDVFAFAPMTSLSVTIDGAPEIVASGQVASGNYHRGLGVTAAAGRLITPADEAPADASVAVLSARYWQRRFGGNPAAVGKVITVNGQPVTIIGVTAPGFNGAMQVGEVVDLTFPLALEQRFARQPSDSLKPNFWWLRIMGRLKPGGTPAQAAASLEGVFQETAKGHLHQRTMPGVAPVEPGKIPLPRLRAEPGGHGLYEMRRNYQKSLNVLMGVVGLVLLVACANVANLLLARGAARRREIAVRLALGASRARVVRQLLAESVLLASLGAAAGLGLALWGTQALVAMQPFGANVSGLDTSLDWRVLGFTTAVALATGFIFGLAPALRATRLNLTTEFRGGVRTLGADSRSALARTLMVVQVALSLVLLIGAGLFVRTLRNLQNADVGFERGRLLLFQVNAVANGLSAPQAAALYERMRERIAQVPGVRRAGFTRVPPLSGNSWTTGVAVPGYVPTAREESVHANAIDFEYLDTLGIPVLLGRNFTARDDAAAPKVAIVNQAFARKYFGEENVIGRRVALNNRNGEPNIEIVGLVRDAQYSGVKTAPPATILVPYPQLGGMNASTATFAVRFTGEAAALTPAIRTAAREVDANLPLFNVRTQEEQLDRMFAQERVFAGLCSFFGALALVLSAIGLYGLMSYAVVRRTGEIGLRMALGALPRSILGMVVRESLVLIGLGVVLGIGAAWAATQAVSSMLFGLSATDPFTYAAVAVLLTAVALVACLLPARRAARTDPMTALRSE